eukprot:CAMPEP_0195108070 /NCGR_PEP_ID=MMETSP0448-20130528/83500_1 /TAXON_ID=66468 /ORGANISM="Heterocapsa triquestra, Strain CCMP 448" /LENGTH=70 /DNA_ID=CAMNT_0040144575 /DNA_START=16 /DNA_END=225 /DNA_ORIENTATION=-
MTQSAGDHARSCGCGCARNCFEAPGSWSISKMLAAYVLPSMTMDSSAPLSSGRPSGTSTSLILSTSSLML